MVLDTWTDILHQLLEDGAVLTKENLFYYQGNI
jgi:hypothetical protein